jgi:hypothetical protein
MTPYQYLNTNNNQVTDTVSSPKLDAYLHSLMNGVTVNPYNQQTDEYGNATSDYEVNGIGQATKVGDNRYSIGVDDPSTRGLFNVNVEVDPLTNKVTNLGTTYGSHSAFDWSKPLTFAALVGGGLLAAPYLGGASLFGEGALAGGGLAEGGAVGGTVAEGGGAVGGSGASLGSGTAYAEGATTNPLSPFYGTAQASPTELGLVSGGGGSTIGEGSIIGSGAGLGQTVPASVLSGLSGYSTIGNNLIDNLKLPTSNKATTTQKQMANALRLPTDLNTNVAVYKQENPFYYSPQQQLANMLKV